MKSLYGRIAVGILIMQDLAAVIFLARFKLRARTALLTTLNLTNYSEFGLIVTAVGAANGWIDSQWLIVIAIALALSFVIGVDFDPVTVRRQQSTGRKILQGDPGDADFWDRVAETHTIELVMLALPKLTANLAVLNQLEESQYGGRVATCARYPDEVEQLQQAGAATVFNIYIEAGAGFAAHVVAQTAE